MTEEELNKVEFYMVAHISYDDEHSTTYTSTDGRIGFCDHVPYKDGQSHGRTYRHWRIDDKVYKTKAKFLEALKQFNSEKI